MVFKKVEEFDPGGSWFGSTWELPFVVGQEVPNMLQGNLPVIFSFKTHVPNVMQIQPLSIKCNYSTLTGLEIIKS